MRKVTIDGVLLTITLVSLALMLVLDGWWYWVAATLFALSYFAWMVRVLLLPAMRAADSKFHREENSKIENLPKNRDHFSLLANNTNVLFVVQKGPYREQHAKISDLWFRTQRVENFILDDQLYTMVALTPDPLADRIYESQGYQA